jgi:hypothetical protein
MAKTSEKIERKKPAVREKSQPLTNESLMKTTKLAL